MQREVFTPTSPGKVVNAGPSGATYLAYVPDRLPPAVDWYNKEILETLVAAERALGQLDSLGVMVHNPYLLIGFFRRREAVLSSKIEGTEATMSELALFEADEHVIDQAEKKDDVREVRNYTRAMEHGLRPDRDLPVSLRLLREMHAILLEGVRGKDKTPGEFRRSQNWIGGTSPTNAHYVPPPPETLPELLSDLERYLHAPPETPILIRLAITHYQFEAIHPFLDGNGRIGRLLITMLLCEHKLLASPMLYLSAYFDEHREEYYRLLFRVSTEGAWKDWVLYFLRGVAEQAKDAVERARRLLRLRESMRENASKSQAGTNLVRLVDFLFEHPAVTVRMIEQKLECTHQTGLNLVERLVNEGVLKEVTGRKRRRVYLATQILDVVS